MKKLTVLLAIILGQTATSQTEIDQILEIGIDNAQRFSEDYFVPAGESLVNSMSNGWYTTAKTKKLWHFEVGIVGNLSFVRDEKQSFLLNVNDYNNLSFRDGTVVKEVTNAFGVNEQAIAVVINEGQIGELEVVLPDGIGNAALNLVPAGFLQGSVGLIKSTEVKLRFLPKIKAVEDAEIQLYGIAFQHEFTDWVFPLKRWPVRLAGLLGYTNVKGFYDVNSNGGVTGVGQEVELNSNSWLITGIVSTKLPVLNFYGGLGYYFGSSDADVLGTYEIQDGPFSSEIVTDPIRVRNKTNGVKATLGARVTFGVFKANMDYSLQNYQNLSLGFSFGW